MSDIQGLPPGATLKPIAGLPPGAELRPVSAAPASQSTSKQGFISSFADSSGLSGLAHSVAHPIDTLAGIPSAISSGVRSAIDNAHDEVNSLRSGNYADAAYKGITNLPVVGAPLAKATDQYANKDYKGEMGTIAGLTAGLVAPSVVSKAIPLAGRAVGAIGTAAEDSGVGVMNKTIGTLKNDFKRGANPGRAYLDAGGKPSLSMGGLADSASNLRSSVGKSIPAAIDAQSGTIIPVPEVAAKLQPPIAKAVTLETGPGGLGNTVPIENYSEAFRPAIKSGIANGGYTPREVYDLKRSIADNTNWSDPSQFNLKAVRQQQVGALGGLLEENVPELSDLNDQYAGLKNFAKRSQSRAETGSMPLTALARQHALGLGGAALGLAGGVAEHSPLTAVGGGLAGLALDSVPVKSSLAYGIFKGGKAAQSLGRGIETLPAVNPAAIAVPAYSLIKKKGDYAND